MKLGPFWRKRVIEVHEFVRKISTFLDYGLWLLIDPAKFKIVRTNKIKNILVVLINESTGNVGGDFCILGVINHFIQENPNVNISILADKKTLNRFGKIEDIDMVEYRGGKTLRRLSKNKFNAALFINLGDLKAKDFDFIPYKVSPFYPSFMAIFSWKYRLNVTRKAFVPWGTHMVEIGFKMFEALGFKFKKKDVRLVYSKKEERKAHRFLKDKKIKNFIVLHPGGKHVVDTMKEGKWPPHLWPVERYSQIADYFSNKGYDILVTGTKEEEYIFEKIQEKSKCKLIDCCGKFSIRELAALLKKSNLLIATDTSVVHVAYQVKIPIIELMGPSCPEISGAWPLKSNKHVILVDKGPCSRSMRKINCPEDIICMGNIKSEDVIGAGERLLK